MMDEAIKKPQQSSSQNNGPSKEEMSEWPLDRRERRIQRIFVNRDHVNTVNEALDGIYETGIRLRESLPGILVGDSRCGKSEVLKRFVQKKSGLPFPDRMPSGCVKLAGPNATVVYLDCYNGATPRQASNEMLEELFDQRRATRKPPQQEATSLLMKHFLDENVALFIIDEAQKMVEGRSPNDLANWIVSLRNAGFFRIIIAGDRKLYELIDTVKVLRDSKKALVELEPFAFRTDRQKAAFAAFLEKFEVQMPFVRTPLTDPRLVEAFYFATRGRPGTLAILFETATAFAFSRLKGPDPKSTKMPKSIEVQDLARAFDQLMAKETRMLDINPFTHSGAFPSYAQTLGEEVNELVRASAVEKKTGQNRGSRLQD